MFRELRPPEIKGPNDVRWYGFDWSELFLSKNESITNSVWDLQSNLNLVDSEVTNNVTFALIGGGRNGDLLKAVNRVTTSTGQIVEAAIYFYIMEP